MTPAPVPPPSKSLTRTGIMLAILPGVNAALAAVPGLDLTQKDNLRRSFRALLTIGVRMMLGAGFAPQAIAEEAIVAIGNEMKERAAKAKEQGATQAPAAA